MKRTPQNGADSAASSPANRRAATIGAIFGAAALGYLLIFLAVCPDRLQKLWLLFVPDELVRSWTGGSWSEFSLADRWPIIALAVLILAGGYGVGRFCLSFLFHEGELSRLETRVFSCGVGLNLLSLYALAVGLGGGLRFWPLFALPLAAGTAWAACDLAAAAWGRPLSLARFLRVPQPPQGDAPPPALSAECLAAERGWFARFGGWLAAPFVAVILLGSMLPPWDFDAREYHLQVPKEWHLAGRVSFLPHNVYGNMPLGAESPALIAMALVPGEQSWWWGALAGKAVMGVFAPLCGLALLAAGKRMAGTAAGVAASVVFLSAPWIVHVSVNGLNEGASAFYWFSSYYATWLALQTDKAPLKPRGRLGLLVLAGFLAGGAVSCKYPAVLFVAAPLAAWVLLARWVVWPATPAAWPRLRLAPVDWRGGSAFVLAVAAGSGLWFAKNAALTGNPVYPLAFALFDGATRTPQKDAQWRRAHAPPPHTPAELGHRLGRIAWRSEFLSPLIWPLAAVGLVLGGARRAAWPLALGLAYLFAVWWLLTHRIDRFLVPAIPLAALLAGLGAAWSTAWPWRCALGAFLAVGLGLNFLVSTTPATQGEFLADNRYFAPLEALRRGEPRDEGEAARVQAAHRWLNDNVPRGGAVLLVGDAQPFDLEARSYYNTCFDDCLFETLFNGKTRAERLAGLRERRISHVYFAWGELARYRRPGNYGYSDYVSRDVVHRELVAEQGLLRRVECGVPPERGEIFAVVGVE